MRKVRERVRFIGQRPCRGRGPDEWRWVQTVYPTAAPRPGHNRSPHSNVNTTRVVSLRCGRKTGELRRGALELPVPPAAGDEETLPESSDMTEHQHMAPAKLTVSFRASPNRRTPTRTASVDESLRSWAQINL